MKWGKIGSPKSDKRKRFLSGLRKKKGKSSSKSSSSKKGKRRRRKSKPKYFL